MSRRRAWRLRLAILEVLRRRALDGLRMRRLLGHFTWCAMLRRELLAIPSACYRFVTVAGGAPMRLWPSVERELRWMAALVPLMTCNLAAPLV